MPLKYPPRNSLASAIRGIERQSVILFIYLYIYGVNVAVLKYVPVLRVPVSPVRTVSISICSDCSYCRDLCMFRLFVLYKFLYGRPVCTVAISVCLVWTVCTEAIDVWTVQIRLLNKVADDRQLVSNASDWWEAKATGMVYL